MVILILILKNAGTVLCSILWMDRPISTAVFLLEPYVFMSLLTAGFIEYICFVTNLVCPFFEDIWDLHDQRWRRSNDRKRVTTRKEHVGCWLLHVWELLHGINYTLFESLHDYWYRTFSVLSDLWLNISACFKYWNWIQLVSHLVHHFQFLDAQYTCLINDQPLTAMYVPDDII